MSDFGYTDDGIPVQWTVDYSWSYWQDTLGNPYNRDEVTPAKVARPGQVVVDATDLRDLVRVVQNKAIGIPGTAAWQRLYYAALAAAEPTHGTDPNATEPTTETEAEWGVRKPDSGQGEAFADFAERVRVRDAETPAAEPE